MSQKPRLPLCPHGALPVPTTESLTLHQGSLLIGGGMCMWRTAENHRIQKFDEDGNFLLTWGSSGTETGQFSFPVGVSTDSSGYVYVVDQGNERVQKFDGGGNVHHTLGSCRDGRWPI